MLNKFEINDLNHSSVTEIIETAQQLEVGILANKLLPKEWSNPGTAGLIAYRLIADKLKTYELTPSVQLFLDKIEACSFTALAKLQKEGAHAFIKPLINQLMEHVEGFKRLDYPAQELSALYGKLDEQKIPMFGQLAYHKENKRFFILIDDRFRQLTSNPPKSYLNHAHCSLNDGMDLQTSERIFQEYYREIGPSSAPLFRIQDLKVGASMVYLNKTVPFSIQEASVGIPKTNSQMKAVYLLNVASEEFDSFKQKGIYCPYPGYRHHVTIGEVKRMAHPSLNENVSLKEALNTDGLSKQIFNEVFATRPLAYGTKLSSGFIHQWPFNKKGPLLESKEEVRANSFNPGK